MSIECGLCREVGYDAWSICPPQCQKNAWHGVPRRRHGQYNQAVAQGALRPYLFPFARLVPVELDPTVWIIVPAYNESQALAVSLDALCRRCRNVVVVDDGSTDQTLAVAGTFPVYLLSHLFNLGQGAALRTGMDFALRRDAQIIVTFDADGQHVVEDIDAVVRPVQQGVADVALGSRFLGMAEGIPRSRRAILKAGVLFTRLFSHLRVTDTHNGLRAFSRRAAAAIPIIENGMAHASEILDQIHRQNLRYCEVPVHVRYSRDTLNKGQSNWHALKVAGQFLVGRILR